MDDVIVLEVEVKGSVEPFQVLLEPYALIIPGENYIGITMKKEFKVGCCLPYPLLAQVVAISGLSVGPHSWQGPQNSKPNSASTLLGQACLPQFTSGVSSFL